MTWRDQARCVGEEPELFFPETHVEGMRNYRLSPAELAIQQSMALSVCWSCPVTEDCLAAGIDEEHGIWGGMTAKERAALRRKLKRQAVA